MQIGRSVFNCSQKIDKSDKSKMTVTDTSTRIPQHPIPTAE